MKRQLGLLLSLSLIFGSYATTLASSTTATPSSATVSIDGEVTSLSGYTIDGYTYFKLRDVAAICNATTAQFAVGYDGESKSISLTTNAPYTLIGTELAATPLDNAAAEIATQTLLLNEEPIFMDAYNINGNTYFQLRQLGEVLDFSVLWDNDSKTILLMTTGADIATDEIVYTTSDLENLIDEAIATSLQDNTSKITLDLEGTYQGEIGDIITLTESFAMTSTSGAVIKDIQIVVDMPNKGNSTSVAEISNITFEGNNSSTASLQFIHTGDNSIVEHCTFNNHQHEALLINGMPSGCHLYIENCTFYEYGLADGSVDGAILVASDELFDAHLYIRNNVFKISREDSDMSIQDMDVAFLTTTNNNADTIFGQFNLFFLHNTITKGSKTFSVDVDATYQKGISELV